jgi:head-tail adaptor
MLKHIKLWLHPLSCSAVTKTSRYDQKNKISKGNDDGNIWAKVRGIQGTEKADNEELHVQLFIFVVYLTTIS